MLIQFGEIEIDTASFELKRFSEPQSLEPKAFNLLLYLIAKRDRVVSKDEIYDAIWDGRLVSEATLTSLVNAARTAIGDSGKLQKYIRTHPRRGYRFIGQLAEETKLAVPSPIEDSAGSKLRQTGDLPNAPPQSSQPSIVVLPFVVGGQDPEQDVLADGIATDISAALSRFRRLLVISHSSAKALRACIDDPRSIANEFGVRFALEGAVRKFGNKVRIIVQLLDSQNGQTIWAERFDHGLEDLFSIEDDITEAVITAIEPEILIYERGRLGKQATDNMGAWQLLQKGLWHYYHQSYKGHEEATRLFRQAVDADPDYAHAQAHLAFSLWTAATLFRTDQPTLALAEAREFARTALSKDPAEPLARFVLGRICLIDGDIDLSIEHMKTGIMAAPNYAGCHYGLGVALYHGKAEADEALAHLDFAARLNPRNPMIWATYEKQSCANRYLGQFERAVMFGLKARSFTNESYRSHLFLAAALAATGQFEDALLEIQRSRHWVPSLSVDFVEQQFANVHKDVRINLIGWLQAAGLE